MAPPLLDGNIIQPEEVILFDTLFTSLLVAAPSCCSGTASPPCVWPSLQAYCWPEQP